MCDSAKVCVVSWWLVAIVSVLLWYRNVTYDRVIAVVFFTFSLLQLLHYGCHNLLDPTVAGRLTVVVLVLTAFIACVCVYLYCKNGVLLLLALFSMLMLATALFFFYTGHMKPTARVNIFGMCPEWQVNGSNDLELWGCFLMVIFFGCWFALLAATGWTDLGLYLIAAYAILTYVFAACTVKNPAMIGPFWTYMLTGIVAVVWISGLFH